MKEEYKDFIGIYDDSINDDMCKEFIKYYNLVADSSYSLSPDIFEIKNDENTRVDSSLFLRPWPGTVSVQYPTPLCDLYWKKLSQCVRHYLKEYEIKVYDSIHSWIFKIHKIKEKQGFYKWHYENSTYETRDRFLAYMTYLQTPSEGGETEFLYQSLKINPIVGRTLVWPAGFTHTHRGNSPLKGEKIYITGWMNMSPFTSEEGDKNEI